MTIPRKAEGALLALTVTGFIPSAAAALLLASGDVGVAVSLAVLVAFAVAGWRRLDV